MHTVMSDAGTFAFIDGKLVQLSPPALMAKMDGKNQVTLSQSQGIGARPLTGLHNLGTDIPVTTPVSTNPAIVSFAMTPSIPLGAVLSIPWVPGSPAVGVNLHGQPQVPNMAAFIQSNLSSPIQPNLTSNIQTAPVLHQNVVQPNIPSLIPTLPIVQPSISSVMPTVPIVQPSRQEGIQQNVAVAPQGVSMVVQNFPPILTHMPSMINQGTINIVNQSPLPSSSTHSVPSTQQQSLSKETLMSTQSSVIQTPSPPGPVISSVQSLSNPHISGKQFIYSSDNDCIGVMETFDPKPQLRPVGAKKPSNPWRTPTPPNMSSKTRAQIRIEPKVTSNDNESKHLEEKPSDLELMSSVQDQKSNSTPVPQTLFKRVMKTTGEHAIICFNLQEKQMNFKELRPVRDENMSDEHISNFSQFNVRRSSTQQAKTSQHHQQLSQPRTSLSNQTVSHQPVAVASSHNVSNTCVVGARKNTTRQSKTQSTPLSVGPHLDNFKQSGSLSSQVSQQAHIPLNVFPNLGRPNKNLPISSQSAQQFNTVVVKQQDTETRLPNYWGGPNRVIHVTSANPSTSIPFSTVSQMGLDLINSSAVNDSTQVTPGAQILINPVSAILNPTVSPDGQYLLCPPSIVQLSSISKMGQDFINPSSGTQATKVSEGTKNVLTSLLTENQYLLCTSSGAQVSTVSKSGQILVNPSSTLVNQSSALVSQSSTGHSALQVGQAGQILKKPSSAKQDCTKPTGAAKGIPFKNSSTGMTVVKSDHRAGVDKNISSNHASSIQSSTLTLNSKTSQNTNLSRASHQKGRTASESLFTNIYAKLQTDAEKNWIKEAKTGSQLKGPPVEIINKKGATSKAPVVTPSVNFTSEASFKAPAITSNNIPFTVSSSSTPTQGSLKRDETNDVIDLTEETSSTESLGSNTRVSTTVMSGSKGYIGKDSSEKQKAMMLSTSSSNGATKSGTEIFVDLTAEEEKLQDVEIETNSFTGNSSQLRDKIAQKGAINVNSIARQSQEKHSMPKSPIEVDLTGPSSPDQSAVFKETQSNNQSNKKTLLNKQSDSEIFTETQSESVSKPSFFVELNVGSEIFAKRVENLTTFSNESRYGLESAGENKGKSDLDPDTSNPTLNLAQYYLPQPNVKKDMEVLNKMERSFNDCFLSFCSQHEPDSPEPVVANNDDPIQKHQEKMEEKITESSSKERCRRRPRTSDRPARLAKRSGEKENSGPGSKRSTRKRLRRSSMYYKYSYCSDTSESEGNYSEYSDSVCMTEIYIDVDTNNDKDDNDGKDVMDSVKRLEAGQGKEAGHSLHSLPVQFCCVVLTRLNDLESLNGLSDPDKLCSKKCREAHIKTLC